jgi:hypothetical protein
MFVGYKYCSYSAVKICDTPNATSHDTGLTLIIIIIIIITITIIIIIIT